MPDRESGTRTRDRPYTTVPLERGSRGRQVVDPASGHRWFVVEVQPTGTACRARDPCLLFVLPGTVRRVWDYPGDWWTLDDAALVALSRRG